MSSTVLIRLVIIVISINILVQQCELTNAQKRCDLFEGRWVLSGGGGSDVYDYSSCPFIQKEFNCINNGRSDHLYLKYSWQPHSCNLSSYFYATTGEDHTGYFYATTDEDHTGFDGVELLRKYKGKSIMFVGDSLSRNQWLSLICMLYTALPDTKYTATTSADLSTFTFTEFGVKVMLDHSVYLVDVVKEAKGRILKLDSIKGGKRWLGMDMLIFNTWHWWNRRGPTQPWDYIEVGGELYKDMDRVVAFEKALNTWANWVDANIDPTITKVFFQGISPSHYNGSAWNEPGAKSCVGQKEPVVGSTYPGGLPAALKVLKKVITSKIKKVRVELLDVTNLSLLRKDGHPSIYGLGAMDCSHWCLPGVPDTWNLILYNLIIL